jgi:NADH-quinone oxidoreductase subunit L
MLADQLLWLIPAFPLAAFLVNGLLGRRLTGNAAHWPALTAVGLSFGCALLVLRHAVEHTAWQVTLFTWIKVAVPGGLTFDVPLKLSADPLPRHARRGQRGSSYLYSVGLRGDGYPALRLLSLFTFSC